MLLVASRKKNSSLQANCFTESDEELSLEYVTHDYLSVFLYELRNSHPSVNHPKAHDYSQKRKTEDANKIFEKQGNDDFVLWECIRFEAL